VRGSTEYAEEYECAFLGQGSAVFRCVAEAIDRGRVGPVELVTDPKLAFQLGIDLGRCNDATVLTVVDSAGRQVYWDGVVQTSYPRQVQAIEKAFTVLTDHANAQLPPGSARPKLQSVCATRDVTGVGLPIYEQIADRFPIYPYTFKAGSKLALIDWLAADLDNGRASVLKKVGSADLWKARGATAAWRILCDNLSAYQRRPHVCPPTQPASAWLPGSNRQGQQPPSDSR
jgi:hypothetical protein